MILRVDNINQLSKPELNNLLEEIKADSAKKYNPELAAFLSLVIPGLGHIFSLKNYLTGSALFLIFIAISSVDEFAGFLAHAMMGAPSAFHAYILATRLNKERVFI